MSFFPASTRGAPAISETIFGIKGAPILSRSGRTIATDFLSSSATLTSSVSVKPIFISPLTTRSGATEFPGAIFTPLALSLRKNSSAFVEAAAETRPFNRRLEPTSLFRLQLFQQKADPLGKFVTSLAVIFNRRQKAIPILDLNAPRIIIGQRAESDHTSGAGQIRLGDFLRRRLTRSQPVSQ